MKQKSLSNLNRLSNHNEETGATPHQEDHCYANIYDTINVAYVNVCGLLSKLKFPEFTEFCSCYDIIALCETKTDNIDVDNVNLEGYEYFFVNRKTCSRASGGVGMFVKRWLIENNTFSLLECKECDNILPFQICVDNTNVIGAVVYIEPENSRYAKKDVFDSIENVLLNLGEGPYLLLGDMNARTTCLSELVKDDRYNVIANDNTDDVLKRQCDEDVMLDYGIPEKRISMDVKTNNYGYRLIDMLKHLGMVIINGRCGKDAFVGKLTCKDKSVVDYAIASPWLLPQVTQFEVLEFNECYSDVHNALSLQIRCAKNDIMLHDNDEEVNEREPKPKWRAEYAKTILECINCAGVDNLLRELDAREESPEITQDEMDFLYDKFKMIIYDAATDCGSIKSKARRFNGKKPVQREWWNDECEKARKVFYQARKLCAKNKCEDSFLQRREANKKYKKTINKAMNEYKKGIVHKIRILKSKNPKEFWEVINKGNSNKRESVINKISCEVFAEHFKELNKVNGEDTSTEEGEGSICSEETCNEVLNSLFTEEEIEKCIHKLKHNKACGTDKIINEFIVYTYPKLCKVYVKLFNLVLTSGKIPKDWVVGIIVPIYKNKGSIYNADNYRGITLLSCVGKLFTHVVNDRIKTLLDDNNSLGEEQAGFRQGYSTVDHIFALNFIVNLYLYKGRRLFCTFVDYRKAFDSVDRIILWRKLLSHNIDGLVLRIIKNMYESAKSCVRAGNQTSSLFSSQVGIRQGENLSPLLFALFLNDLISYMHLNYSGLQELGAEINKQLSNEDIDVFLRLYVLLYADDTIVLAESANELQKALDILERYCDDNNLVVNSNKTKVMIFSRGSIRNVPQFHFKNKELEVVKTYQYLGIVFNYNGHFKVAQKDLCDKATRAMFSVIGKGRKLGLPIDILIKLFDCVVKPIILYGAEVWGPYQIDVLERVQLRFLKLSLKLPKNTPTVMVRGETGCNPLKVDVTCKVLSYWFKVVNCQNEYKIANIMYRCMYSMFNEGSFKCQWLTFVKDKLDRLGLSEVFIKQGKETDILSFKALVKQRSTDQYMQEWSNELENNTMCSNYRLYKKCFKIENYLMKLSTSLASNLLKFRTRSIFGLRYDRLNDGIPTSGKCYFCNAVCGDEFHLIMECKHFKEDRSKIKSKKFFENVNCIKFDYIMNDDSISYKVALLCRKISLALKAIQNAQAPR